jgi:hypothetical protein
MTQVWFWAGAEFYFFSSPYPDNFWGQTSLSFIPLKDIF